MFDDLRQLGLKFDFLGWIQVALENRVLEMIAKIAAGFQCPTQAFVVRDIVGNYVGRAHMLPCQ
jgi:hypothetical protein